MNSNEARIAVDEVMAGLKDFQQATVEYVFSQLFTNGRDKMLVADEVGLGKTIVAKGLIAKAFERHMSTESSREFHVIYICSNHALADQNVKKLKLFKDDIKPIERLVYLAHQPDSGNNQFRLSSLSPGTSFYLTRGAGEVDERRLLFTLLSRYKYFRRHKNGLQYLLIGKVTDPVGWKKRTEDFLNDNQGSLRRGIFKKFKNKLHKTTLKQSSARNIFKELNVGHDEMTLWHALQRYAKILWGKNYKKYPAKNTVVGLLRQVLTEVCLGYLKADLFILDEFQRYRDLIKTEAELSDESPAIKLARQVFGIPGAKVLMLSATPFKPYTGALDISSGEDHYTEFKLVLQFLMQEKNEAFWEKFESDRKAFFHYLRRPKETAGRLAEAMETKQRLEFIYNDAMVRTERVMVSDDNSTMLTDKVRSPFELKAADVNDFIQTDKIVQSLNKTLSNGKVHNPIEYAKSAPFPLSFMDRYKLKEHLDNQKRLKSIQKTLRSNPKCWIDLGKVNKYKPLMKDGLPNGKLRCLLEDALYSGGWKLLWVTPTIPYYELFGPYAEMEAFSKTIVFSSWVMVPRMIASLVSYEAERLTIGDRASISKQEHSRKNVRTYFQKGKTKRRPRPQLVFKKESKSRSASKMSNFCILYPSPTLAALYHPRQNLSNRQSVSEIRREIRYRVRELIEKCNLRRFEDKNGESSRWYWAAPILLDQFDENVNNIVAQWISLDDLPGDSNVDPESEADTKKEKTSAYEHLKELNGACKNPCKIGLGKMPDDLEDVMADMVLGSPAICSFRALDDFFDDSEDVIKSATIIAKGFLTLFNKPESIATVRLFSKHRQYWRKVLQYSLNGNIQAMIDEFVFLLFECENYRESAQKLAEQFAAVMNVRTSSIRVDSLKSFLYKNENPTMRCHYALDFGNQKVETLSGKKRIINLREAFNSPFKPFVLASTSIGQEGLDFHYYCRKIMHWNLPSNAIDIEQREGRINRYMGHVIRKNIAVKYLGALDCPTKTMWKDLFLVAKKREQAKDKCDLVPYWHVACANGYKIERIVPLHPFSKDIDKFKYLLDVLTFYRLTFGQPRQEELVEAIIQEDMDEMEVRQLISNLVINLSPITKKIAASGRAHGVGFSADRDGLQ